MQLLASDSISVCFFSPKKCLMDRQGLLLWFAPKYSTQLVSFLLLCLSDISFLCFFVSLLYDISFSSHTTKISALILFHLSLLRSFLSQSSLM